MSGMAGIDEERLNHGLALHAKLLCSGVFVVGREPEEFIANDLLEADWFDWDAVDVTIDRDHQSVTLQCEFGEAPPRPPVDLLLAVPRPKVLRRLWAQIAALGVGRIILTNAERVERNYFDTHVLDSRTYRPLLIEGLQQARDTRVPEVSVHRQFRKLVEDELDALSPQTQRLVADPTGVVAATAALRTTDLPTRVLLAVGPEGGWNPFELALLHAQGFSTIGLGPRTLRADTACLALLAIVHEVIRRR